MPNCDHSCRYLSRLQWRATESAVHDVKGILKHSIARASESLVYDDSDYMILNGAGKIKIKKTRKHGVPSTSSTSDLRQLTSTLLLFKGELLHKKGKIRLIGVHDYSLSNFFYGGLRYGGPDSVMYDIIKKTFIDVAYRNKVVHYKSPNFVFSHID
jgi:hypothetical protein